MRQFVLKGTAGLAFLMLCTGPAGAAEEAPGYLVALAGEYVVVGRRPVGRDGDGRSYSGTARIDVQGREVSVRRTVDGVETRLVGGLEPALGGDAEVLRLRAPGAAGGLTFTCLERGDLDNYIRLTCVWTGAAEPDPREPGLEAWFPTGAWPSSGG